MRSIITSILVLSIFASVPSAANADGSQLIGLLLGIGFRVYESNQQLRAIDRLNKPLLEQIKAQAAIQRLEAEAQTMILGMNQKDRAQFVATVNAKLQAGTATPADLEIIRLMRGMLAVNANQVGVGSVTIGRGAEFGGGYYGGYAGGYEEGGSYMPQYGGSYSGGGYGTSAPGAYRQAQTEAQMRYNDAVQRQEDQRLQELSRQRQAATEAQMRYNEQRSR